MPNSSSQKDDLQNKLIAIGDYCTCYRTDGFGCHLDTGGHDRDRCIGNGDHSTGLQRQKEADSPGTLQNRLRQAEMS